MPTAPDTRPCYNLFRWKISWSELTLTVAELKEDELFFSEVDSALGLLITTKWEETSCCGTNFLNVSADSTSRYLAMALFGFV